MHTRTCIPALVVALLLYLPRIGHGQSQVPDQLGQVDFANSCRAAVQGLLQRGVAMLHSFWFHESEKAFRAVLAQDPSCAIATWGVAAALMANPLAGHGPSPPEAQRAQAALAEGYGIGTPTQREREYLDAVAVYYQAWETRPERARQQSEPRRSRRWPPAIRLTTKRRSSPPSIWPRRSHWPITPMPSRCRPRRCWNGSLSGIPTTRALPTT